MQPPHLAHKINLFMEMKKKPEPKDDDNYVVFGFDDDDRFNVKMKL